MQKRVVPAIFLFSLLVVGFLVGFLSLEVRAGWETSSTTITVSDDFYVSSEQPSNHYEVASGYDYVYSFKNTAANAEWESYFLFNVSGYENITSAILELNIQQPSVSAGIDFYACNLTGDVSAITWSSQPTCDRFLGHVDVGADSSFVVRNVTLDPTNLTFYMSDGLVLIKTVKNPPDNGYSAKIKSEESSTPPKLHIQYSYFAYVDKSTVLSISDVPLLANCGDTLGLEGNLTDEDGNGLGGMTINVSILSGNDTLVTTSAITDVAGSYSLNLTIPQVEIAKTVTLRAYFDGYTSGDTIYHNSSVERTFVIACSSSSSSDNTSSSSSDYISQLLQLWSYVESGGDYLSDYIPIPAPLLTLMVVFIAAGLIISILAKAWKWLLVALFVAFLLGFLGVI